MEFLERLVAKLHIDRFFNSKLILAIDLVVSLAASTCVLICERVLIADPAITRWFIFTWAGLSLIFSLFYF